MISYILFNWKDVINLHPNKQSFCGYIEISNETELELSKDLTIPILKPIKRYEKWLGECCARIKSGSPLPLDVIDDLGLIFQSASSLNASFLASDHFKTSTRYHGISLTECCTSIAKIFNHRESLDISMKSLSQGLGPLLFFKVFPLKYWSSFGASF